MSDYDDWDGGVAESITDNSHAAHKPLAANKKSDISKEDRARRMTAIREALSLPPTPDPKPEITRDIEEELAGRVIIKRPGRQ